jgi:hypothetical protein
MTNHNNYIVYFLIFLLMIFSTCESDYNLSIPDQGRRVVINGFLSTEDTISVQVFESKYILDSIFFYRPLKNPVVQLWIDEQYAEDLHCRYTPWSPFSQYKIDSITYLSSQKPVPDKTYSIKVLYHDLPEAFASVKMPSTIPIDKIDTTIMANHTEKQYSIHFKDPGITSNYYFLKFFLPHMGLNNSCDTTISILEKDFKAEFLFNEKFIFSDRQFNGKNGEVRFLITSVIVDFIFNPSWSSCPKTVIDKTASRKMYIKLYNCSEEFYLYYKSFRTILERGDDVFYEPVKVYSNVKNGYGILAAYNTYVDSSINVRIKSFTSNAKY